MTRAQSFRLLFALVAAAALPVPAVAAPAGIDYGNTANWLCLPGRQDACGQPLTSTVVAPDGSTSTRTFALDPNAPVDCFYVYPTVSREPGGNADMTASPEVQHAALEQFALFGTRCKLYAPIYRQTTIAALRGEVRSADEEMPYADVLAAWNTYLARYNHGRGVVLIGHSQGTKLLTRLIASQIDGTAEQKLLVSAFLIGGFVVVPAGRDVGGTFTHVPLCRSGAQIGCVIAYSSYLSTDPPGTEAFFGAAPPGSADACVDPAALEGRTVLDDELPAIGALRVLGTTFVETQGQLTGACVTAGGRNYLAITPGTDARSTLLKGALEAVQRRLPGWGLHTLDVNLTIGNLLELVDTESKAWLNR